MKSIRCALFAAVLAMSPAVALAQTGIAAVATPENRWSDSAEIVIRPTEITVPGMKRCPSMWKLRRGNATLFVLADLLTMPDDLKWDSTCFEKTLQGANALLLQADPVSIPAEDKYFPWSGTLRRVVSRQSFRRFEYDARRLYLNPENYSSDKPQWAPNELVEYIYERRVHVETYPANVPGMARRVGVPIQTVPFFVGTSKSRNIRNKLNDAEAEACMNSMLDRVEYLLDTLPPLADAWAKADMATVLKLFPDPQYGKCVPPGDTSDRELYTTNMKNWADAMDAALNTPGKTVAVVPLDWLLYKGGALDQLQARGVDVIAPVEDGE